MSELPDPSTGLTEPVPAKVRMLATFENLGTLRSIHQPTSWFTRLQFRQGRIYLFDQGFVLGQAQGARLSLFRWGQFTVRKAGRGFLVTGADRRSMGVSGKWSGFPELREAITAGARTDQ